ncbi:hypothetical protein ACLKMH_15155 [Psychromonas sp. KJ10-10]|uniref:hypothetical protein n=1 Tax=Psychromonas sp. KJ10-10 TaxID=3391823 RepID=UPI0039B5B174
MAPVYILSFLAFILPSTVIASTIDTNKVNTSELKKVNQTFLYGSWQCAGSMEYKQINMSVTFDYKLNFTKDYKSSGEGIVSFGFPNYYDIDYKLTDNSTWNINNNEIIYTSEDLQLTNLTYPELEKIVNLEKRVPTRINESSKILKLTSTQLTIQTKSDNKIYNCSKI